LAATEALLKVVIAWPVLVFVVVVPPVTTSVPAAEKSVPCLMENVTLGVVPASTALMAVIVMALVV
jgi:hypothetical protein